eukprot:gene25557-32029_t
MVLLFGSIVSESAKASGENINGLPLSGVLLLNRMRSGIGSAHAAPNKPKIIYPARQP